MPQRLWAEKKGITKVSLPDTVKTLQEHALAYNYDLIEINFGKGLESIGDYAVAYCEKLKAAVLPSSLKSIGDGAFTDDVALTEIVIPEGIEAVGYHAFSGTDGVNKITIPASMNELESYDFSFESLEEVNFKGDIRYFDLNQSSDEYYDSFCQDKEKVELNGTYDEITEKSYNAIICRILNKQSIKLNGKEIQTSTDIERGKYTNEASSYQFEIAENNELIISYGIFEPTEIARLKYQIEDSSDTFMIEGQGAYGEDSIDISGIITPLGDKMFVELTLSSGGTDGGFSGLWSIS